MDKWINIMYYKRIEMYLLYPSMSSRNSNSINIKAIKPTISIPNKANISINRNMVYPRFGGVFIMYYSCNYCHVTIYLNLNINYV